MSETTVLHVDDEDPDVEPPTVIVEAPEVPEPTVIVAPDSESTTAALERAAALERENADLKAQLAYAAGADAGAEAAEAAARVAAADAEAEEPTTVDDEIVDEQIHPWFRPLSSWRHR